MNKLEYDESISDIRALINNRGKLRSKFGLFNIENDVNDNKMSGIWNCLSKNVIVVINRNNNLIRVRRNSVYYSELSGLKNWKVIPSDTLGNYRSQGKKSHNNILYNYLARPQYEQINKMKNGGEFTIDLGKDKTTRNLILSRIRSNVSNINKTILLESIHDKELKRKYTVNFKVEDEKPTGEIFIIPDILVRQIGPSYNGSTLYKYEGKYYYRLTTDRYVFAEAENNLPDSIISSFVASETAHYNRRNFVASDAVYYNRSNLF